MTNRLFITLDIPEKAILKVSAKRDELYGKGGKVKWEPFEKLHVTVKFLGDVEEELTGDVKGKLKEIAASNKPVKTAFSNFGLFYRKNEPKILWAGIKTTPVMENLVSDIENSFTELGFEKEKRKFKPHITLLRIKGREDMAKIENFKNTGTEGGEFIANSISLYKSKLLPSGSVYEKIEKYNLE